MVRSRTIRALLLGGLGWGNMPEPMVRDDLAAGRLVRLQIETVPSITYGLFAINRLHAPPGPAGRWLIARLGEGDPADAPGPEVSPQPFLP